MNKELIVKQMVEEDELLKFRYGLYINLEGKTPEEALKQVYENVICNDVYRLNKYKKMKARKAE